MESKRDRLKAFTDDQKAIICKKCFAALHTEWNKPMALKCCGEAVCEECVKALGRDNSNCNFASKGTHPR